MFGVWLCSFGVWVCVRVFCARLNENSMPRFLKNGLLSLSLYSTCQSFVGLYNGKPSFGVRGTYSYLQDSWIFSFITTYKTKF